MERLVRRVARPGRAPNREAQVALQTARMVAVASHRAPVAANCLPRSLVLWGLLRSQGVESTLRLGFRREDRAFAAHAWVERLGVPLNDIENIAEVYEVVDFPQP